MEIRRTQGGRRFEPSEEVRRSEHKPPSPNCESASRSFVEPSGNRPGSEARIRTSIIRDHTNPPQPPPSDIFKFEVANYITNEHIKLFHQPQSIFVVGVGVVCVVPKHARVSPRSGSLVSVYVTHACMRVCVCMYACVRVYACMHVCVCEYAPTYGCMDARVYGCISHVRGHGRGMLASPATVGSGLISWRGVHLEECHGVLVKGECYREC